MFEKKLTTQEYLKTIEPKYKNTYYGFGYNKGEVKKICLFFTGKRYGIFSVWLEDIDMGKENYNSEIVEKNRLDNQKATSRNIAKIDAYIQNLEEIINTDMEELKIKMLMIKSVDGEER